MDIEHDGQLGVLVLGRGVNVEKQAVLVNLRRVGIAGHDLFQPTGLVVQVQRPLGSNGAKGVAFFHTFPRVGFLGGSEPQFSHRRFCIAHTPEQSDAAVDLHAFQSAVFCLSVLNHGRFLLESLKCHGQM